MWPFKKQDPLIKELKKIPKSEWAEISCEFNSWKFPKHLIHLKPTWWFNNHSCRQESDWKMKLIRPIMDYIEKEIGRKEILRHHNVNRRKAMTEEYFENWYSNTIHL